MSKRKIVSLMTFLLVATAVAAVEYWPSARRRALARIESLDGRYLQQPGSGGIRNTVVLAFRPVTEDDLAALTALRPLHALFLPGSAVNDADLKSIGALTDLEELDLSATPVTDKGLTHLAPLQHLQTLFLRKTGITDAGLVH